MTRRTRRTFIVAWTLAAAFSANQATAQEEPAPAAETPAAAANQAAIAASNAAFTGFGFGAGLSVTVDIGEHDRISDATVDVNGIVRVNKKNNVRARMILETHYFFPYNKARKMSPEPLLRAGWGPFVAAQPGEDDIIEAAGIGLMFGWRRPTLTGQGTVPQQSASFNLGIGVMVDPNTKILGEEFKEDQAAPRGPDGNPLSVRLQETDQSGVLLVASFTF